MSIELVVPEEVELTTLLDELRKLSWDSADVLMAYARGEEPPYGFPKSLNVEEGGDGPVSAADNGVRGASAWRALDQGLSSRETR